MIAVNTKLSFKKLLLRATRRRKIHKLEEPKHSAITSILHNGAPLGQPSAPKNPKKSGIAQKDLSEVPPSSRNLARFELREDQKLEQRFLTKPKKSEISCPDALQRSPAPSNHPLIPLPLNNVFEID